ncbi:uncharacterized PE-PGRS family protein PE_PGRS54 isoform X10 [Fundulus heteroclitus]|uniref:uncharacterized PE-PGRS family protein PE_PGRS54 isoform X10 n=1 Tax=Fundulus heteroclitus TaxID=8078 RepID=UPI00165AE1D5|nr:uncharacterized PE-PGRS family protein PE_PGRS54 isoform X10 [Fundulus heteroclitus]
MLPPNLLIVSIVILLATTASLAPVEEKEVEEVETEATEMLEGEVSEEEEDDDDDSKSQDNIDGALRGQQTTVSAAAAGGSASSSQSIETGPHVAAAGGSGHGGDLSSVDLAAAGHLSSSSGSAVSPGSEGSTGSAASVGSAGSAGFVGLAESAGSPGSVGSMGFAGSVDSAGSAGSVDSAGSAGSAGSVDSAGFVGSAGSAGSVDSGGSAGSVDSTGFTNLGGFPGSVAVEISGVSAGQTHSAGADHLPSSSKTDMNGPDGVDSETNGNGQKLLNGGGGGAGVDIQTGIVDSSSHDYLLNLMGGGLMDPFSTDGHVHIPAHLTPPPLHNFSVIGPGVTVAVPGGQNIQGSPADSSHHSAGSTDQSGVGGTSLSSGSDQSLPRPFSGSTQSAVSSTSLLDNGTGAHQDGAESSNNNGNGRQTMLSDMNGVTERIVSLGEAHTQSLQMQTDLTGGTESVTSLHVGLTNSGLGRDVTERSPITLSIESAAAVTDSPSPASGVYSNTEQVTVMADSTGTDTVTAHPAGTPFDSTHPAGTDHTQMAGWACPLQVQSLNSTTHLVMVLKVLKMWNWRISADFHIKPRVRFIRFQIPCTDQSAWPGNSDSTH